MFLDHPRQAAAASAAPTTDDDPPPSPSSTSTSTSTFPSPDIFSDVFSTSRTPSPDNTPDLARLRQTHTTSGYRDGITAGKSSHLQAGFDEGYLLGGRFGLKIGWILGVAEGLSHLQEEGGGGWRWEEAERELAVENVFGREWFGEGGVWKYDVGEEEGEGEGVTLDRIVERHPLVRKWVERVRQGARRLGLEVEELGLDGEEADVGDRQEKEKREKGESQS